MVFRNLVAGVLLSVTVAACTTSSGSPDDRGPSGAEPIVVAASFYPIAEIVSRVGGENVEVVNLTPPGTEAHDVDVTAKEMQRLNDASVTFYLGNNFQPNVEAAISSVNGTAVDLLRSAKTLTAVGSDEVDPHVWLDPENMARMTRVVADTLSNLHPDLRRSFSSNADDYVAELDELGSFLDASLARCDSPVLITAHRSFSYLAARARLETNSLLDYSGEDAATGKAIEAFADFLRSKDVTTVFYEEAIARESMQTVAELVGARTSTLNPVETISRSELAAGATYLSIQRHNINGIADGLRCS